MIPLPESWKWIAFFSFIMTGMAGSGVLGSPSFGLILSSWSSSLGMAILDFEYIYLFWFHGWQKGFGYNFHCFLFMASNNAFSILYSYTPSRQACLSKGFIDFLSL
jgi:hypothetical protein